MHRSSESCYNLFSKDTYTRVTNVKETPQFDSTKFDFTPYWREECEMGWGKVTTKIITALSLTNEKYFDVDNHDGLMMNKQLKVQLVLYLIK